MMLDLDDVVLRFGTQTILSGVTFKIRCGEKIAIVGPSGAGKSSLLRIIAGVQKPTSGSVLIDTVNMADYTDEQLRKFRATTLGIVYQEFNLLNDLTVLENVLLPTRTVNAPRQFEDPFSLLEAAGVSHLALRYPEKLSGGEKQRVALCRALINRPSIVLADEPTGNLDHEAADRVSNMLLSVDATVVTVTHNQNFATMHDTVYRLANATMEEAA